MITRLNARSFKLCMGCFGPGFSWSGGGIKTFLNDVKFNFLT